MGNKLTTTQRVALENVRHHQIGGERDGISLETADDLGFGATLAALGLANTLKTDQDDLPIEEEEVPDDRIQVDVHAINKRPHLCAIDASTGSLIISIELGERGASPEQYDRIRREAQRKLTQQKEAA